jgi:hypothetical protein
MDFPSFLIANSRTMPRNNTREHQCYETPSLATFFSDYRIGNYANRFTEQEVLKGRKLVEKGRSDLREGEQLVAAGNVAVQTNREAYQALSQTSQGIVSAEVASERASELKKIAKAWVDGEENISEGNELIHRGNARVAQGESEIKKGHSLMELGRIKMQDVESRYQPVRK